MAENVRFTMSFGVRAGFCEHEPGDCCEVGEILLGYGGHVEHPAQPLFRAGANGAKLAALHMWLDCSGCLSDAMETVPPMTSRSPRELP